MIITMLYPSNVMPAWHMVAPLLAAPVALSGTHDVEDVRRALLSGQAQLWVQWEENMQAVVVTEFVNYPRGMWLRLWLGGAPKDSGAEWEKIYAAITEFAYANHCVGIENWGREGWMKFCPDAKKQAVIIRFPLAKKDAV